MLLCPLTLAFLVVVVILVGDVVVVVVVLFSSSSSVLTGSPSRGGDVTFYAFDVNLPTPFNSVLVSISVFMDLSTVFHSINSPDSFPFSHSVLPVLSLSYWSFQLHVSFMKVSFSPDIIRSG